MNKWLLGVLSIGVSVLGFHLGNRQVEEKTPSLKSVRMGEGLSYLKRESKRSPSEKTDKKQLSLKYLKRLPQSQGAGAGEKEREEEVYFRSHLADRENLEIYIRTKELFQDYETKEFMARWMVLGNFFSSSKSYGELFISSVRKLNEDPKRTLEILQKSMDKMGQEDSFLRGMAVNLVHHLDLEDEDKVSFFGKEIARPIEIEGEGDLGPDASSIVPSLLYLKQYTKDERLTVELLKKSLDRNREKPEVKKALRERYLAFFPKLAHRI